jgi:putative transposase
MVALARFFDWREALAVVKPETFLKWHRTGFKLFRRWKSRHPGRPPLPKNLRELVRWMAQENPTWGEQRIASELLLKLGIHVAPRTIAKHLDFPRPRGTTGNQRWSTFVRNHANGLGVCRR